MSRVYDLWEKLVGGVLDREELRRLALRSCSSSSCSSFSDYSVIMLNCASFDAGTSRDCSNSEGTSRGYNKGVGHSSVRSSAGLRRFSAAFDDDDACLGSGDILLTPNLKVYSFGDLKNSARNFKSYMVLGIGYFGTVYMGWVDEKNLQPSKQGTGMIVAIKRLDP